MRICAVLQAGVCTVTHDVDSVQIHAFNCCTESHVHIFAWSDVGKDLYDIFEARFLTFLQSCGYSQHLTVQLCSDLQTCGY